MKTAPILRRATFRTSRLLDFANQKELIAQTGHGTESWPLVIIKELADNAIDACEEEGTAPVIVVEVDESGITVRDNGPGLPARTVKHILDFTARVSSREAYVSPTRGAQGNALKTIVAMPYVVEGESGHIEIEAHGIRHRIEMSVDRVRQEPVVQHDQDFSEVKIGTVLRVHWPLVSASIIHEAQARFLQIAEDYTWLNPHLSMTVNWFGETSTFAATETAWQHWLPSEPTSPHWYEPTHLERLVAGYVTHDLDSQRVRTARELVGEFRGLAGSAKQKRVLHATGLTRAPLNQLVSGRSIDSDLIKSLLSAMKSNSAPVKPVQLGSIGRDHFAAKFAAAGAEMDSFDYRRTMDTTDGVPWIVETAFGWCPEAERRRLVTGVNWSPGIINPFRELGWRSLDTILAEQRAGRDEPVILALHMVSPRIAYTDRGKSAVVVKSSMCAAIVGAVQHVTAKWTKQRKREERETSARVNRLHVLTRRPHRSIRQVAWEVMASAYAKASAGGTLPAHARQIMYAARAYIQREAERPLGNKFDQYFTQTLLPDYIGETGVDWHVVYDARGHFLEPHTGRIVPLGTLQVRDYLASIKQHRVVPNPGFAIGENGYPTLGPKNRFGAILFVEKEGFQPLFESVKIAERYDVAIMSTKGMSVTASRELIDQICNTAAEIRVPLLVLHDFDKAGFGVLGTLHKSARRYAYRNTVKVVDLGLRIEDIAGLETEDVFINSKQKASQNLIENGASAEEVAFLLEQRVELNAFPSDELISWLESKLDQHGVAKVVPDEHVLAGAYRRMHREAVVQQHIDELVAELDDDDDDLVVPANLKDLIQAKHVDARALPWDEILRALVKRGAQ